jgi:uncharacterized OB-fold protein
MTSTEFYLPGDMPAPIPTGDGMDAPFWEGTRRSEIVMQRCAKCGTFRAPEWICYNCHSFDGEWVRVSERGTIYAWERPWLPAHPALNEFGPYLVVLVELEDAGGMRLVGNLLGDPLQDVTIGAPVEAAFEHHENFTLVQWRTVADR